MDPGLIEAYKKENGSSGYPTLLRRYINGANGILQSNKFFYSLIILHIFSTLTQR